MTLEEKINEEIKKSAKSGDKIRLETVRSIRASIIEFVKSGANKEMTPEIEQQILMTAAKRRRDSIQMYEQGNRPELADKEKQELQIIEEYLPKQLSEDETKDIVKKIIADAGAVDMKDLGKVMGPAMKELKGKADGNLVQKIVRELLGGNG